MIPVDRRPAGYLLTIEDLTDSIFWAKSLSGKALKAQVGFDYLIQFKLAEIENGQFSFLPAFYDWFPELGDAQYSVDNQGRCLMLEWDDHE